VFRHILIPLDGSERAASAVPAGTALAACLGATITLLHVIEKNPPRNVHGETHIQSTEEARQYLRDIGDALVSKGLEVRLHVHPAEAGNVASSIVGHEQEFSHDLIVMCTHGKGGASQLLFGSIAQQVIAAGTKPVLLIPVKNGIEEKGFACSSILVPLDGRAGHEQALDPAAGLASSCGAALHLLMVVPERGMLKGMWASTGKLLPFATSHMLDMWVESGGNYLQRKKGALEKERVEVRTCLVRGDPSSRIVEYARSREISLTALGTHGRKGVDALLSASVVNRVLAAGDGPFLLVP
jgi:nucleotide-binding universal stress UspA family protein